MSEKNRAKAKKNTENSDFDHEFRAMPIDGLEHHVASRRKGWKRAALILAEKCEIHAQFATMPLDSLEAYIRARKPEWQSAERTLAMRRSALDRNFKSAMDANSTASDQALRAMPVSELDREFKTMTIAELDSHVIYERHGWKRAKVILDGRRAAQDSLRLSHSNNSDQYVPARRTDVPRDHSPQARDCETRFANRTEPNNVGGDWWREAGE